MKQIGLIPSGLQLWYKNVLLVSHDRLFYCSSLAIYVYRLKDYSLERIITGHTIAISTIRASLFNPIIATSALDQTIRFWDVASGKCIKVVNTSGDFKPFTFDLSYATHAELACGGKKGTIRFYNHVEDTYFSIDLKTEEDVVRVLYNPRDLNRLFAAAADGTVYVIELTKHTVVRSFKYAPNAKKLIDARWDPKSKNYILCAFDDGKVMLFDTDSPDFDNFKVRTYDKIGSVGCVEWIPHEPGNFIVGDSKSGLLRYYNISQTAPLKVVKIKKNGLNDLFMIPNENRVIIGSREGSVGVFDLTQKKFDFQTPGSHTESIFDCEFCASDPDIFATSSFDASIKLWDMQTYECIDTLGGESVIYSLSWHPTKKLVAGAFDSGSVYIYDVLKRAILLKSTLHKQTSFKVAWNQLNPTLLASTSKDKTCVVFAEDGKLVRTYRHGATVFGVDWSPLNQNLLATGAHDYAVRVYDVEQITEHAKVVLKGHTSEVFNVKWHPTLPDILVSGSNDHTVRVWNVATESCIVIQGHTNNVRALHWSPEFSHIVLSGSWDGTIRVWDCHTQKCITTVNDHHADVYGLSSHPKRPFVFGSTSRDSTIRFFSLESTFKELFIRAVTKKSLSELIGTPQSIFNQQATFGKMSGSGSKEVNSALSLANSDVERFGTLYDFLSAPHDTRELWNMASICVLQSDYTPKKTKLVHSCQLTSTLEIKARELEAIKHKKFTGIGMARKEDALREAALIFLKIGQVQKYCECMAHIGQWEKALALAPAVSQYYWAELSLQHARHLAAAGNDDCVPIYIVTGEVEKAVDFLVGRNQIDDAVVIAQANAEASYPLRTRITSPITPTGLDETLSPVSPASPNTPQKTSGSVGPCIPVTIDDNIKRVIQLNAQRYLNNALPTLAAATYLSINAYDQAIQVLVQGNEILLAYALVLALKNVHSEQYDDLVCSVATLCIDNNLHDLGTDLLENVSNRKQIDRVVVQVPQDKKEKIFVKVGLQSVNFYASQAGQTSNKADSVRFYALCGDTVKSATVYCAYAKELFSKAWDLNAINEATDAVHVCDASELNPPLRDELLAYCNFVAAKNALDKGYYTVAPCMVRNTRNLVKNGSFEFGIKQSELDTLLVEAYVNYDREEALHLVKQILESKSLSGESVQKMTTLQEQLFNKTLPPIDNSKLVIPTGSNHPLRSVDGVRVKSVITQKEANAPLLHLEGDNYISVGEAVMWYRVCPFSPLCTGKKLKNVFN